MWRKGVEPVAPRQDAMHASTESYGLCDLRLVLHLDLGGDEGSDQPLDPAATQIIRCRTTLEAQDADVRLHNVYEDNL